MAIDPLSILLGKQFVAPRPEPVTPVAPEPIIHAEVKAPPVKTAVNMTSLLLGLARVRAADHPAVVESTDEELGIREVIDEANLAAYDEIRGDYDYDEEPVDDTATFDSGSDILDGVNFALDPSQVEAVHGLVRNQYGCLIGAAGTGKTTTTRFVLHTLINGDAEAGIEPVRIRTVDLRAYHSNEVVDEDDMDDNEYAAHQAKKIVIPAVALVAFTGQATQVLKRNMPPSWRKNVMTIHSLLGFAPVPFVNSAGKNSMRFEPTYDKYNKMPWNIIFVDEASMVNLDLWHQLLDAAKPDCRFYFIGDLNQLTPPIGLGILGFALAKWPVFELTHVHRSQDDAANRIIDTAWSVLQGKPIAFDNPETNPNWRVIGFKVDHESAKAHSEIIRYAKALSEKRVHASVDPAQPFIYDPWRDRIMTAMNGYDADRPESLLGQFPLNDSLSKMFADPTQPRIIIDAKKVTKRFAVGYRVMATKNEPPNAVDRVTNGLTGKITDIQLNPKWFGDWRLVGSEEEVAANRSLMLREAIERKRTALDIANDASHALDELDMTNIVVAPTEEEEKQGGPASHIVTVEFDNGGRREYSLNAQVEQLQIAYASTTHKAQGAEMPTAIIVVHHAQKKMLCRENLYTAVTRARQRVIIFYTDYGMRIALANQKISGSTIQEKVKQYQRMLGESVGDFKLVNVRLTHAD